MAVRVLLIEDNSENLEVMTCLLDAFGHTSLVARDGVEGLRAALAEKPDLIVCDLQMPKMDGFELCKQLKCDPSVKMIPLVAVTAQAMTGDRERVLDAGFDGYITKPIDPRNFVKQLESYVSGPKGEVVIYG